VPSRFAITLVSIALVASGRAIWRSSTAFASSFANAAAAERASSLAFLSAALFALWSFRFSLGRGPGGLRAARASSSARACAATLMRGVAP